MMLDRRRAMLGMGALPLTGAIGPGAPVTVFEAKHIVTMEPSLPGARFMAVGDGTVLALADTFAALEPWTSGRTVSVDRRFARQVLFPGLIDPHVHPMQSAVMLNIPFLAPDDWTLPSGSWPGVRGQDPFRAALKAMLTKISARPAIVWGWHELFHGPLDRAVLDAMAPDFPVVVWQRSFHDIVVNSAMLRQWGLESPDAFAAALAQVKADPAHGDHAKGLFSETALPAALAKLRPAILSPEAIRKGMTDLKAMLANRGVTTVSDMATGLFADFDTEAGLIAQAFAPPGARCMLMPTASGLDPVDDVDGWMRKAVRLTSPNVRLDRRIKLFADGAFFSQGMRMGPPGYSDGHVGKWLTEPDALHRQLRRYWELGFSLHIHVNGDEGADTVLEGVATLAPGARQTITLEHLGYVTAAQARRIARLGLMVSAQPNYIRVLGDAYATHGLGPDRSATINRLGSLEREGVPLGLHSDFNMAPIDPFYLAWITLSRRGIEGRVHAPGERLSLAKALRAITIEAAQVIGLDAQVGSLAAGKRADFVALDADPHRLRPDDLKDLPIRGVAFEGQVVREG